MKELMKVVIGVIISVMMVMGAVNHNSTSVTAQEASVTQSTGASVCLIGSTC